MKIGDLIKITWITPPGAITIDDIKIAICLNPNPIELHNHWGYYHAIETLSSSGKISYPIDRWNFEVISENW